MSKGMKGIGITALVVVITFMLVLAFFGGMKHTVPTVVAARPLAAGTKLTARDVRVVQIHASARLPGAFRSPDEVVGKVLAVARAAGDQITKDMIGAGAYGLPAQLDSDTRAVGVHVNRASGVLGDLRPGDRVTVIGILDPSELGLEQRADVYAEVEMTSPTSASGHARLTGGPGPVARVMLSGLKVLLVPQSFRYRETTQGGKLMPVNRRTNEDVILLEAPVTPITLTVHTSEDVTDTLTVSPLELLTLLDAKGRIYLALEPLERAGEVSVGVSAADVLNFALEGPPILPTPTATPTATPAPRKGRKLTPTPTPTAAPAGKGG